MDSLRSDLSFTVCSLLTWSAKNWPERCALDNLDRFLTYGQLDEQSDQLAHVLSKHGVRRGDCVAVVAGRSIETVVALAAILKVGAAYLPLDPALPHDTLLFTLRDAQPTLVMIGPEAKALDDFACIELETALAFAHCFLVNERARAVASRNFHLPTMVNSETSPSSCRRGDAPCNCSRIRSRNQS